MAEESINTELSTFSTESIAAELLDIAELGIWKWHISSGKVFIDERWASIAGYTLEELGTITLDTWRNLLHPKDRETLLTMAKQVYDGKTSTYQSTFRIIHKDGHIVWIFGQGIVANRSKDGKPLWMVGSHTDISETVAKQLELKEKKEQVSVIFNMDIDMMCVVNKNFQFEKINDAWFNSTGYTKEEMLGKSIFYFIHPDDCEKTKKRLASVFSTNDLTNGFVNRYRAKNGVYRYFEWRDEIVSGEVYATARDITRLVEKEEKFRILFEDAPLPIVIHDAQTGAVLEANKKAAQTFKTPSVESFVEYAKLEVLAQDKKNLLYWIKKGAQDGMQMMEWLDTRMDGEPFWEQISVAPVVIENKLRVISTPVDIHEIKKTELDILQKRKIMEAVSHRQHILTQISALFVRSTPLNFRTCVQCALNELGQVIDSDRIFIYRYYPGQAAVHCEYSWQNKEVAPIAETFKYIPIEQTQYYMKVYTDCTDIVIPDVSALPGMDCNKKMLQGEGIQSLLCVSISLPGKFYGLVGIANIKKKDDCFEENYTLLKEFAGSFVNTMYRILLEQNLVKSEVLLKSTLLSIGDAVICTDADAKIYLMNHLAEELTGYTSKEALGLDFDKVFAIHNEITGENLSGLAKKVVLTKKTFLLENHTILTAKDGTCREIEDSASPIFDCKGNISGVVVVFRDCGDKKKKERELEYLSMHDTLTGLYNRRYMENAETIVDKPKNYPLTVMYADINGLKLTNDAFGHEMGDKLLLAVCNILKKSVKETDIIGRVGGDEFILFLPKTNEKAALQIKYNMQTAASKTRLGTVVVSISVGFATKLEAETTLESIKKNAENRMYRDKLRHGKTMRNLTIQTVLQNINEKYENEQIHTERTAAFAEMIAREMGLEAKEIEYIKTAAILHDVGKITVPPELLNKPGRLTQSEFDIVKRHAEVGCRMLRSVDEYIGYAKIILHHHERCDGRGYPEGLAGDAIPLGSRIIAIADSFEAMTAQRAYHIPKTVHDAVEEVKRCAGTQFDAEVVSYFVRLHEQGLLTAGPVVVSSETAEEARHV